MTARWCCGCGWCPRTRRTAARRPSSQPADAPERSCGSGTEPRRRCSGPSIACRPHCSCDPERCVSNAHTKLRSQQIVAHSPNPAAGRFVDQAPTPGNGIGCERSLQRVTRVCAPNNNGLSIAANGPHQFNGLLTHTRRDRCRRLRWTRSWLPAHPCSQRLCTKSSQQSCLAPSGKQRSRRWQCCPPQC